MKILLWATSLQADILGLALRLDGNRNSELLIVAEHSESYRRSPIARLRPLRARLLDRADPDVRREITRFMPSVVVCDNHFPPFEAAPRVCAMWHGLGWKARPPGELSVFHKNVERLTGRDARSSNLRFLAQCYHERDRRWRIEQWGLSADRCVVTGSCFADLLRGGAPYSKADLEREYSLDLSKKTLLVNITWHYGRIFPGSWRPKWFGTSPFDDDLEFVRRLFARARDHGANVLFCLHDRKRYEPRYMEALHRLAREHGPCVALRHKDEHPDNWADLVVADAMISNLSSFATFFYHFGKPSVHICPPAGTREVRGARYSSSGLRRRRGDAATLVWMNDPRDNGGLSAETAEEALEAVSTALSDPDCCRERAAQWLAAHVASPAESASARFESELERFARGD